MADWLCDQYAEARRFYGASFDAIYRWQEDIAALQAPARKIAADMIDEVAHQTPFVSEPGVVVMAMMR